MAVADPALVDHGAVVRHLHGLADAGLAALHYPQFVGGVVQTQRRHLVAREPLPAAPEGAELDAGTWRPSPGARRASPGPLVVEEEHQVEPPVGLLLPLLPQAQDVFGRHRDGHPVVQQALLWHLRIDDLQQTTAFRFLAFNSTSKTATVALVTGRFVARTVFLHFLLSRFREGRLKRTSPCGGFSTLVSWWFYQSGIRRVSAAFCPHQLQRLQRRLVLRAPAAGSCADNRMFPIRTDK